MMRFRRALDDLLAGCSFRHLGGFNTVLKADKAYVRIVNSTIADNLVTHDDSAVIYLIYDDAGVWLLGTTLVNNTAPWRASAACVYI